MARTREVRSAIVVVNVLFALSFTACTSACVEPRTTPAPSSSTCARRPLPWGTKGHPLVGANVIDVDDTKDDDPVNDGARGYGSDAARRTLAALRDDGLSGVVLPVPLRAPGHHAVTVTPGPLLAEEKGRARLGRMIDDARALGLAVVVVPHLALDDGSWRGDLAPRMVGLDDDRAAVRFLASYADALAPLASLAEAHCADALSVAVELKSLSRDPVADEGFQALIAGVRARFSGVVTYSANWDEVMDARHWRALDVVGVNAFAPLATTADASDDALRTGARGFQDVLAGVAVRAGKPAWMIEAGFKSAPASFVEPWRWPAEIADMKPARDDETQARAYRALFAAARENTRLDAVFLWAVPSDLDDAGRDYPMEPGYGFSWIGKKAHGVVREMAR